MNGLLFTLPLNGDHSLLELICSFTLIVASVSEAPSVLSLGSPTGHLSRSHDIKYVVHAACAI